MPLGVMPAARPSPVVFYRACSATSRSDRLRHARTFRRHSSQLNQRGSSSAWPRYATSVVALTVGVGCWTLSGSELHAEAPPTPVEVQVETPRTRESLSKEDNRDLISSQHLQVKRSWENPGVYAWGSNAGNVVAPESDEAFIKVPRRITFFDGTLLRDLKLSQNFGAAISERGDLLQWGAGYSREAREPSTTLKGKDLVALALSKDRILALSSSGSVYSVSMSKQDQLAGKKPLESTWLPFWYSRSPISYRQISPSLSWSEKVVSVASGQSHGLLLTSSGRVFSAAASSTSFPSSGELGVPGLTWATRPEGEYDQPHEIATLKGFDIKQIACGDTHSLVLDSAGRVFSFGDNTSGQLGFEPSPDVRYIDAPSLLPINKLYAGTSQSPKVTSISAGGSISFFTVEATKVAQPNDPLNPTFTASTAPTQNPVLGRITADTWACGSGILGTLGHGKWTHNQGTPVKIKMLSGLYEFDEQTSSIAPIRLARLSVGATHASAVMANVTHLSSRSGTSEHDTNWGADVLWWGGNESYQLGTGRRNNVNTPIYIGPLDGEGADGSKREEHRFHITPKHKVKVGGRTVSMEQRVECGNGVTAVYSGV